MNRPSYKTMWIAEKKRADFLNKQVNDLNRELHNARLTALTTSQDRSRTRGDYATLYRRSTEFMNLLRRHLFRDAVQNKGWVQFPALSPEDGDYILREYSFMSKYLDEKTPPAL